MGKVCVVFGCVPRMDGLQEAGIYPGKNMSRSAGTCTDRSARSRCVFLGTQAPPSRSASSLAGAARASKERVNLKSSGDEDVMGRGTGGGDGRRTRITRSPNWDNIPRKSDMRQTRSGRDK
jgi:hypothetical protein